jgi:FkbM family methyltransferase
MSSVMLASSEHETIDDVASIASLRDVDLVIPMNGRQLRVPASDRSIVPHMLRDRSWEPHLTRYLLRELRPADVFVDVGANIGYFVTLCAPLVSRVVAFEPVTANCRYCASNIALNQLTNVELHQMGLWHEEATLPLRGDLQGVNAAIAPSQDVAGPEFVRLAPLDGLLASNEITLSRLDVLKMDIEGAEVSALSGMRATIERFRPRIVMELNPPMLATFGKVIDDVWQWLRAFDYQVHAFAPWQEQDPVPVADLEDLKRLCPPEGLVDIAAVSPAR